MNPFSAQKEDMKRVRTWGHYANLPEFPHYVLPFFPPSLRVPRVDDGKVISGIICVIHNGLRWRDGGEDERRAPFEGALDRGQPSQKRLFSGISDAPKAA